jgi:hypothetical protein
MMSQDEPTRSELRAALRAAANPAQPSSSRTAALANSLLEDMRAAVAPALPKGRKRKAPPASTRPTSKPQKQSKTTKKQAGNKKLMQPVPLSDDSEEEDLLASPSVDERSANTDSDTDEEE